MVNGEEVVCSADEEANIKAFWALNEANPAYSGACAYDGASAPYYLIDDAKLIHNDLIEKARQNALTSLNADIETAQENGADCTALYATRKSIKEASVDLSAIADIASLKSAVPSVLQSEFDKLMA